MSAVVGTCWGSLNGHRRHFSLSCETHDRGRGGGANPKFSRPAVDPPSRQITPTLPLCRSFTSLTHYFTPFSFHFFTFTLHISPTSKPRGQTPNPPTSFLEGEVGGSSFFASIFWGVKTRSGGVQPSQPPRQIRPWLVISMVTSILWAYCIAS